MGMTKMGMAYREFVVRVFYGSCIRMFWRDQGMNGEGTKGTTHMHSTNATSSASTHSCPMVAAIAQRDVAIGVGCLFFILVWHGFRAVVDLVNICFWSISGVYSFCRAFDDAGRLKPRQPVEDNVRLDFEIPSCPFRLRGADTCCLPVVPVAADACMVRTKRIPGI